MYLIHIAKIRHIKRYKLLIHQMDFDGKNIGHIQA